jgi:type II secretory pathway pseudopilin PulG
MKPPETRRNTPSATPTGHQGFTLPAVLVVAAALLILAVGILTITAIERRTARSYVDLQRAELAARAGLEDIKGILTAEAANDDFIVLQSTLQQPIETDKTPAPHLFLARGKASGPSLSYRYVPLFSTTTQPAETPTLTTPTLDTLVSSNANERTDFNTQPFLDKSRAAWIYIQDDKGRNVGRYAYFVEDLQSKLDPALAGNTEGSGGTHARTPWPHPAPGINPEPPDENRPALDQVALHAIDPATTADIPGPLGKTLITGRPLLVSPDSLLAAADIKPPLTRDPAGRLTDVKARAVEENLASSLQSYLEQPLIPYAQGISPTVAGQPKLNLNELLSKGDDAVAEMAEFIDKALPEFKTRKGGFPDDYLRTLAANAIDYADEDPKSTLLEGSHRGLDGYPLVSEFLMRFRWENVLTENGRKFIILSATTYAELWNMSDQTISGSCELSYETKYEFPLGANPSVTFDDMADATPKLPESEGYRWFPAISVSLRPNEYKVFNFGTVTYKFDAGPAAVFVPSPLELGGETYGSSDAGYRMKWNGQLVDQSRGGVHRNNSSLNYPTNTENQPRQRIRTTIPCHSHTRGPNLFKNNMGDPRMAYYLESPQDANVYPGNYSPNRRNIRWDTIYKSDGATKPKVYGRVLPSEWPDGGHNSLYGSNTFITTSQLVNPDDARFFSGLPTPRREEAPLRLSNQNRFYSATELGRIYDPIMWETALATPGQSWGDVTSSTPSTTDFGGGNSLRIGRPEHPRFDKPETHAARLLDLFHAGIPRSEDLAEREGPVTRIEGHINLNTASRDAIRAVVAGELVMDPLLARRTSENHETNVRMAPPTQTLKLNAPTNSLQADRIADAIIRSRPFDTTSSAAGARESDGTLVFGNKAIYPDNTKIHWTDSAAEELFARLYESSTVRSRNYRVWVVGQSIAPTTSTSATPEILAEVRRVFTVFADPGERQQDGSIDPSETRIKVLHENAY